MEAPRRHVRASYPVFWSVALLSNIASGAQLVAVMWLLSDPEFSLWVLVNYQLVAVAGSLLGIAGGSALVSRLGVRRTLLLATTVESLAAAVVAISTTGWDARASEPRAVVLGAACALVPLGAGLGGPAWLALVAAWPGANRNRDAQLLLDGAQFQLGRLVGPLLAGWALTAVPDPVARIASTNVATFMAVGLVLVIAPDPAPPTGRRADRLREPSRRAPWRTPIAGAIALTAFGLDSTRTFLARYMREAGEAQGTYAVTVAVIALGGAVTAFASGRSNRTLQDRGRLGCLVAAAALAVWSLAPWLDSWAWAVGGALLGPAVAITSAWFTSSLMAAAPGRDAQGAATAMAVRTASGSVGGVAQSVLIPVLGTLTILGGALLMVFAWLVARPPRRDLAPDGGGLRGRLDDGPECRSALDSTVDPVRSASERDPP